MPIIVMERAHFEVLGPIIKGTLRGQMGFADEAAEFMYNEWGWIQVYGNLQLKCKICGATVKGFDASPHLQTGAHVEAESSLRNSFDHDGDWCEDCPMLIQENNPYYDTVETVCRLGFAHVDKFEDKSIKIVYRIGEELWRPQMCKEKMR